MVSNRIKSNLFTIQPNNTKKYLKTKQTLDTYKFTQNKKSVSEEVWKGVTRQVKPGQEHSLIQLNYP